MRQEDWDKLLDRVTQAPEDITKGDKECRQMYAIWLRDELDDELMAACQQWMVDNNVFPRYSPSTWFHKAGEKVFVWEWWEAMLGDSLLSPRYLPRDVFKLLNGHRNNRFIEHLTRQEAEQNLCQALVEADLISVKEKV